ncbi:Cro/Cl family transcriptional regulator, partial [Dorea formicigenerans]|nr:Cro/Cl family transcriptional regulator [Dorea formicigenerans]MBT9742509.1 Cro/Cl family transcriptional regulator [Dorea formicigenerans]
DPTLKMLETITAKTGIDYLKEIRKSTKLTEKHYKIIEQQTTSTEDVILEKEN